MSMEVQSWTHRLPGVHHRRHRHRIRSHRRHLFHSSEVATGLHHIISTTTSHKTAKSFQSSPFFLRFSVIITAFASLTMTYQLYGGWKLWQPESPIVYQQDRRSHYSWFRSSKRWLWFLISFRHFDAWDRLEAPIYAFPTYVVLAMIAPAAARCTHTVLHS